MTKQQRQVAPHMGWTLEKTTYKLPGMAQESDHQEVVEVTGRTIPDPQTTTQYLADGGRELIWQSGRLLTGASAWVVCLTAFLVCRMADGLWQSSRRMAEEIRRPQTDGRTYPSADGPQNITVNVNPQITING